MLPFVKKTDSTETKVLSKQEQKKGINIRWNSAVVFQMGLLASLGLAFLIIESNISLGTTDTGYEKRIDPLEEVSMGTFVVEPPKKKVVVPKEKKVVQEPVKAKSLTEIKVVDDRANIIETKVMSIDVTPVVTTTNKAPAKKEEPKGPRNVNMVEFVPVFPGCEGLSSNDERKACMSKKMNKLISKRFDTEKFSYLDSGKIHSVNVMFTIGKDGQVKNIKARAAIEGLENEAKKVIAKMPTMTPGKQGDRNVDVLYMLPIKFKVD